jgi:hypothetical protein
MARARSVADWFSVRDPGWGRVPRPAPLTASAIQTAIATAIVLPGSYALDPQRYYWG